MQQRPKRYLGIRSEDRRPIQPREYGLLVAMGLALAILVARLWYLQVLHGEELAARAELVRTPLDANRPAARDDCRPRGAHPRH
jgi:cell division protein FtsI/penicillin-binding protein 2